MLTSSILKSTAILSNLRRNLLISAIEHTNMKLQEVCAKLEEFGSLCYAEKWDNVGLLCEPSDPIDVKKIMLTNDLTENVMSEALKHKVNMIISYHPPIFQGLKRLTNKNWKERIIVKALENKIAIYSPHTVWDSVENGTSHWLANAIPNKSMLPAIPNVLNPNFGAGRICKVDEDYTLREIVEMVKKHTEVTDLRIGVSFNGSFDSKITTFGCCPGSGASVLKEIKEPIDLFVTGEMSHHEVLEANSNNISVIMLNHSNSERGYLKHFAKILKTEIDRSNPNEVEIIISEKDQDPLKTI